MFAQRLIFVAHGPFNAIPAMMLIDAAAGLGASAEAHAYATSNITCWGGNGPSSVDWSLSCSDGTTLRGGESYASSSPLTVALHATCTLSMMKAGGTGQDDVAVWEVPGFGQKFVLQSGRSETFAVVIPLQLPPTAPPPVTNMQPRAETNYAVAMRRQLTQVSVSTVAELIAALGMSTVDKIMVAEGRYEFTNGMCSDSALCISGAVTLEAEVAGGVVLDGMGGYRVFKIESGGTAVLIGLNITGGSAVTVCLHLEPVWALLQRPAGTLHVLAFLAQNGAGLYITGGGVANLDGCQVYENVAGNVRACLPPLPGPFFQRPAGLTVHPSLAGLWRERWPNLELR